jgi:hypothetical protein
MAMRTPHRFTVRATGVPRRVGRALEGAVDTDRRYGDTLDVQRDGRLDVRIAKGSPLRMTRRGLDIDPGVIGEKNRAPLKHIADVASGATLAETQATLNEILAELRKTKNMRGGF